MTLQRSTSRFFHNKNSCYAPRPSKLGLKSFLLYPIFIENPMNLGNLTAIKIVWKSHLLNNRSGLGTLESPPLPVSPGIYASFTHLRQNVSDFNSYVVSSNANLSSA